MRSAFLVLLALSAPAYGSLPIAFEKNVGQTDAQVCFLAHGPGYALFITNDEVVLRKGHDVIRMRLSESRHAKAEGEELLEAHTNYFIGSDPSKWRTNVPAFAKVRLPGVYEGIDVVYYGTHRQLEYDFIVKPGADPRQIRLRFDGIARIDVDEAGDLVLHGKDGVIRQHMPFVYQERAGSRVAVGARYRRLNGREFGIAVGAYDAARPLIIDPTLVYSTYAGGSASQTHNGDEAGSGIAVDSAGNAYVTGFTGSANFPTASPAQGSNGGFLDAFVMKLNASGTALIYSTYLGGSDVDFGNAIAVDGSANAYITGWTSSNNFPTLPPPQFGTSNFDAFVAKLSPTGSLIYSMHFGGTDVDGGNGIAVDGSGNAYVTGLTSSTNFPTAAPLQASSGGGGGDAFVAKVNPSGTALVYSTYLGGSSSDEGKAIAIDSSGNAYVTGFTFSTNFPTVNPVQGSNAAFADAFVTKVNPTGSAILYSTYLGGNSNDEARAIVVDSARNVYVAGDTSSTNFPTANPLQPSNSGGGDAFVTKLNASGSALLYSTYLGGSAPANSTTAYSIAVDAAGDAYVTGDTSSTNFQTVSALQASNPGGTSAFISIFNPSGSALLFSTYLGGSDSDYGYGIAIDGSGGVYVTGQTRSADFPTVNPFQASDAGGYDVFVSKIALADTTITKSHSGNFTQGQTGATYTITVGNTGSGATAGVITVTDTLPAGFTAAAMSGTGWSCTTSGTPTCTRGDALATGSSYPPITLTVNVSNVTAGTFVNAATVSGGGEVNTANDTATDTTIVTPNGSLPIPALQKIALALLALALVTMALVALRA